MTFQRFSLLVLGTLTLCSSGCKKQAEKPAAVAPVQAIVARVVSQPLAEKVALVGSFEASEQADLVSELDAHVALILFKEGQKVRKGEELVHLDAARPAAALASAESEFALRSADLERGKALLANGTTSAQDFDKIQAAFHAAEAGLASARVDMDYSIIKAPFDGVVADRTISEGGYVHRGQIISSVVVTDPLKVHFNVPERYVSEIADGQTVDITSPAYPGNVYTGTVYFVSPRVDEATRTILVKALIPNPDGHLRPGMFGHLDLVLQTHEAALVIPEAAVQYHNNAAMVVAVMPGNPTPTNTTFTAAFRPIEVGVRLSDSLEVLSGLKEGDLVVVEGYQKMGPGSSIKIAPKSKERYGVAPPPEPEPQTAKH